MSILDSVEEATTYKEVIAATSEPTGFENSDNTDTTLSFDDGTRTFTITPIASSFEYWIAGVKYTQVGADSLVISDVEGVHYIYYDGSTLSETTTFDNALFRIYAYVAAVYWDATNNTAIYLGNERHGVTMDGDTHTRFHEIDGTKFESGLAVGDILADESGALDTHAQLSVTSGEIHDEDIELFISALSAPAQIPVYYKDGAGGDWRKFTATDFPVRTFPGGSSLLAWNEFTGGAWQQTEATNNKFILTHIFATNDINSPMIVVQGEAEYTNQNAARTGATNEINSLITAGLPFEEFVPIATVIFQTNTGYGNSVLARIRTTDLGEDYVEWRFSGLSPTSTPSSHFNLSDIGTLTHDEIDTHVADTSGRSELVDNEVQLITPSDINSLGFAARAMVSDNGAIIPQTDFEDGDVNTTTDEITVAGHNWRTAQKVRLLTTGTLPGGLAVATDYYVIKIGPDDIQFAVTVENAKAGTQIDITSAAGGGTHSVVPPLGTQFLHTPTGRKIFYVWNAENWQTSAVQSFGPMAIFTDKSDGLDSINSGFGVDSDAFATIEFAKETIPPNFAGNIDLNINNETYVETLVFLGKKATGPFVIKVIGQLTEIVSEATADIFSTSTIGVTGAGYTPGANVDKLVRIVDGTGVDKIAIIASNTTDTNTIVGTWRRSFDEFTNEGGRFTPTAPDGTSKFVIEDWATEIQGEPSVSCKGQRDITFQRIYFAGQTDQGMFTRNHSYTSTYACKFTGDQVIIVAELASHTARACLFADGTQAVSNIRLRGARLELANCKSAGSAGAGIQVDENGVLLLFCNLFHNNTGDGLFLQSGSVMRSTGGAMGVNGNDITSNGGWGVRCASGAAGVSVQGWNYVSNSSGTFTPVTQLAGGTS